MHLGAVNAFSTPALPLHCPSGLNVKRGMIGTNLEPMTVRAALIPACLRPRCAELTGRACHRGGSILGISRGRLGARGGVPSVVVVIVVTRNKSWN